MYARDATKAFKLAARSKNGAIASAPAQPIEGTTTTTRAVFIATPVITAGTKPHFLFDLFTMAMAAPAEAIPNAMGIWRGPKGKPLTTDVAMCPIPLTKAPSSTPKSNAAKKPAKESKATDCMGLGGCMKEPTTQRAVKTDMRATLRVAEAFITFMVKLVFSFMFFIALTVNGMINDKSLSTCITIVVRDDESHKRSFT